MVRRRLGLACAAVAVMAMACSSKARAVEDARSAGSGSMAGSGSGSAGSAGSTGSAGSAGSAGATGSAGSAGSASVPSAPKLGDVQIRVEWADVPVAARASPGRTPCNTPRSPSVSPTTTWGIPDAIVIVEGAHADSTEARVVLADCALSPRTVVGASLIVESATDRPVSVLLAKRADASKLEALTPPTTPRTLRLPIAGHAVAVSLDPGGVYELSTSPKDPETSWIIAATTAAVTDTSGQTVLRGLPAGPHAVTAWLPPRAGQPARIARGSITAVAGELAELTLTLTPTPTAP